MEISQNTPTPRTDAAWAQTFDANGFLFGRGNAASQMRDECATLERELAALTTERDQLRAEVEKIYLMVAPNGCDLGEGIWGTAKAVSELKARAEKAEAELAAERARLDSGTILLTVAGERVWHCGVDLRAAIDAGIKEGTK
jgi:hypothetical protein